MQPHTQVSKRRRREAEKWRCGVCFLELPEHAGSLLLDLPCEAPVTSDGSFMQRSCFSRSARRGCCLCRLLWAWSQSIRGSEGFMWRPGRIKALNAYQGVQVFIQQSFPLNLSSSLLKAHPFVEVGDHPSGNTRSRRAFEMAALWMLQCRSQHHKCKIGVEKHFPKRILFIKDPASLNVRLIENADTLSSEPYVCLSHRWMPQTKASSLTRDKSKMYQKRIPRGVFYELLRDTVEATYRLGFRYLWIDCLCIYQDDIQDWHIQASEMSSIYENAAITISALSSDTTPGSQSLFARQLPQDTLTVGTYAGREIFLRHCHYDDHPFQISPDRPGLPYANPTPDYPLISRGWAYQERLLSKRTIHFTKKELIWECKEAMWCECRFDERLRRSHARGVTDAINQSWVDVVVPYSRTSLSIESDRLPALSGIARRFGSFHGWTYLAGIWKEDINEQLMWVSNYADQLSKPRAAPSWSWASVQSTVYFVSADLVTFIDADVTLAENPFGNPRSATLVLEGHCIAATILHGTRAETDARAACKREVSSPGVGSGIALVFEEVCLEVRPDYVFDDPEGDYLASGSQVLFMVAKLDEKDGIIWGLVLTCIDPLENKYERIGVATNWPLYRKIDTEELGKVWEAKRVAVV